MPKQQQLEQRIMEDLEPLGYRFTTGSGNKLGDTDVKPRFITGNSQDFAFECKDRSTMRAHSVPGNEWKKAKLQARAAGFDPVFVTRNADREIVAHLAWGDFMGLLERLNQLREEKST